MTSVGSLSKLGLRSLARNLKLCSTSTYSTRRPELNFDFLLDESNTDMIRLNIQSRKGVGDIDGLLKKWKEMEELINTKDKPKITELELRKMWDEIYDLASDIPNMSIEDVPVGDETNAKILCEWGEKRTGNLLTAEKLVQGWRALIHPVDACGERSYVFLGALANLERALLKSTFERLTALGFKPVTVPDLVSLDITEACGVLSRKSNKNIQYTLKDEPNVALSGTAEMGIASLLKNQILDASHLPLRLVSMSRCFRPEISHSASEAKLYRVHEFNKVEMFTICTPEQSESEMEYLVQIQKGIFESLGLHCRQLLMPSEELGAPAARKIDIEAWMPGRQRYGEVSSASNCKDFQARRLGIKYRTSDGKTDFVHTFNGTGIASTRAVVSILETFQTVYMSCGFNINSLLC
ncbi:unnamed protein product [Auanema sp. JU1783]|nr:unnamed protein product [Auanema sp. JU1783]